MWEGIRKGKPSEECEKLKVPEKNDCNKTAVYFFSAKMPLPLIKISKESFMEIFHFTCKQIKPLSNFLHYKLLAL